MKDEDENMFIIGELINSTRKSVSAALKDRNEATIRGLIRSQLDAGADVLDVNTATRRENEIPDMEWVIGLIHDEGGGEARISVDSPDPEAMDRGLELCTARPLVNSISNEPEAQERLLPLVKKHDADMIGLTLGKTGMPKTVEGRLAEAQDIVAAVENAGIDLAHLYVDSLAMTVGSNQDQAPMVIETVRTIKERWGEQGVKTSVGLSNVSFGLPRRSVMNRAFLAMLLNAGLDAAILDPTDKELMGILRASEALIGKDAHCLGYIKHMRQMTS